AELDYAGAHLSLRQRQQRGGGDDNRQAPAGRDRGGPQVQRTLTAVSATVLYTPQVLGLATGLARWSWDDALALTGAARSRSCGSTLAIGLGLDPDGRL